MSTLRRSDALSGLFLSLLVLCAGCGEAVPVVATVSLDIRTCVLSAQAGAPSVVGGGICAQAVTERFADGLTACLAFRTGGKDGRQPYRLQGGQLVPLAAPAIDTEAGSPILLKLFVLRAGSGADACATYTVDTTCQEGEPASPTSCLFALRQEQTQVSGDKAATIVYGGNDSPCGVECNDDCDPSVTACRRICGSPSLPLVEECDGRDNDCDGQTDEDFEPTVTHCGQGLCAANGSTSCVAGAVQDSCSPGSPAAVEECNGQDDDCDGQTDEEFPTVETTCGVGACAGRGRTFCEGGSVQDSCVASAPVLADDSRCDGVDGDCDGFVDEDYRVTTSTCGRGACVQQGQLRCLGGRPTDTCEPAEPLFAQDDTCNGIDDDCDGPLDEEYSGAQVGCGVGACAALGLSFCQGGEVKSSCTPNTPPVPTDLSCNGIDDDCDGTADEDFVVGATVCGAGRCRATGELRCLGGRTVDSCTPGVADASDDSECNGLDDDCDGQVDEDARPAPSSCGRGDCAATGIRFCLGGQVEDTCQAGHPALLESCDQRDNNCDGTVDEGCGCVPGSYEPVTVHCGVGACASVGYTACVGGQVTQRCSPGLPSTEVDASCNGVDDDCDDATDEEFVAAPTQCGIGACAATGRLACADGVVQDSCHASAPAVGQDLTCNGVDDDCDGQLDEEYVAQDTHCGQGACAASGRNWCIDGQVRDTCVAGQPAAGDASCDGVDDDCDGQTDEHYVSGPTTCGLGACAAVGQRTCSGGQVRNSCSAGVPAANDASCNRIDDDCDGQIDEDALPVTIYCGVGACRVRGRTLCVSGQLENYCTPGGALGETDPNCDGVDDDCDGQVDEEYASLGTSCGLGECAAVGSSSCVQGVVQSGCTPGPAAANDSLCNGDDDDCDGRIDEDCSCVANTYVPVNTQCGTGACLATGRTSCVAGSITDSCQPGAPAANDASCNGVDDDCDGLVDEDFVSTVSHCGVGECGQEGLLTCVGGALRDSCRPSQPGTLTDEQCDGADDDCDGEVDEDYPVEPLDCGVGACAASGWRDCLDGRVVDQCSPGVPAVGDASCNGADNDCDGATDEDYLVVAATCGLGVCASTGSTACVAGQVVQNCTPKAPWAALDTTCNRLDEDCDGLLDDDFVRSSTSCGVGACLRSGLSACVDGVVQANCTPGAPAASDVTCNAVDDDCDGNRDEDYVRLPTSCGVGGCAAVGLTSCVSGAVRDSCTPGTPAVKDTVCDGVDEDCDRSVDEDYVPLASSCGLGACVATGTKSCSGGRLVDSCVPGTPGATDDTCNAVDNDCDGQTDEAYPPLPVSCGVGVCVANGQTACAGGLTVENCTPGQGAADDSQCNGLDDDCDGATDENCQCNPVTYQPLPTSCGLGACLRSGSTSCNAGVVVDSCVPGAPAADTSCNGVDEDCDGQTDESYAVTPISCGQGVCTAAGQRVCQVGAVTDLCTPGPAGSDANCNGLDNDCDGQTDEHYVVTATTCGVGACTRTGQKSCQSAQEVDSCTPGQPAASDATCNGVDDDCDGQLDENYVPGPTSCGTGACASTGTRSCSGGVESNSCLPKQGAADDPTCDNVDDDCDGLVDDEFPAQVTQCGVGACAGSGERSCVGGTVGDTCLVGTPVDELCDAQDNDCDASTDEGFNLGTACLASGSPCGAGVNQCACGSVACVPGDPRLTQGVCSTAFGGSAFPGVELQCNTVVQGNTDNLTNRVASYYSDSCPDAWWNDRNGAEKVYAFRSDTTQAVRLRLSGDENYNNNLGDRLDLFVLQQDCLAASCVAMGPLVSSSAKEQITFTATAGVLYYVVIDGDRSSDHGPYWLRATCPAP